MAPQSLSSVKSIWKLFSLTLLLCVFLSCRSSNETPVKVSLSTPEEDNSQTVPSQESEQIPLRVAISAIISPKETYALYKDLLDYLSLRLQKPVKLVLRETYAEVNNLVRDNELDMAFVCSGAYVDGHEQFGMELLVAPVAYGSSVYYSYIIVPYDSDAKSFVDLRNKRFAFTDPMSNTGKLAPTHMLAMMNETIDSFFSKSIFTYSHDQSIDMVAHSLVDGAAVDSLIWEYLNAKDPDLTSKTRIIEKSEPFGIPPIVVPHGLAPDLKEQLKDFFLTLHNDTEGRQILEKLKIERFVVLDDRNYDSIRRMKSRTSSP